MLRSLTIENIALIDRLHLEFSSGLSVLTGETGSGKSIILEAIAAVLGGSVSPRMIRAGAEQATIKTVFTSTPLLSGWLASQGIALLDENTIQCSLDLSYREFKFSHCSRLNGVILNPSQLVTLREHLLDITAQGQTLLLARADVQQDWLDRFGGADVLQQRQRVSERFAKAEQTRQAWEYRRQLEQERQEKIVSYKRQLKELKSVGLSDPHEIQHLEEEHRRLNHAVVLQRQSYQVYQLLYQNEAESPASADLLGEAAAVLDEMVDYDRRVEPMRETVQQALALLQDAARHMMSYGESIEADPQRLADVTQRLSDLKQLCRRYGPTLSDVIAYQKRIQAELIDLTGGGQSLDELEQAAQTAQAELHTACAQLTHLRQQAAQALQQRLLTELRPLVAEKVQFQVQLEPTTPTATGADRVSFWFSPNPGEGMQPLAETASGGEMSRFLLALKACFSQTSSASTLIFDEIDVGVSGQVAQAIADKLHQLSHHHQVLCVTHQPIVAAMATHHFRVSKQVIASPIADGNPHHEPSSELDSESSVPSSPDSIRTITQVSLLDDSQRRDALAELVGGSATANRTAAYDYVDSLLIKAARRRAGEPDDPEPASPAIDPLNDRVDRLIATLSDA
jgi:DNA repair protein RecN (Recombination protein N)